MRSIALLWLHAVATGAVSAAVAAAVVSGCVPAFVTAGDPVEGFPCGGSCFVGCIGSQIDLGGVTFEMVVGTIGTIFCTFGTFGTFGTTFVVKFGRTCTCTGRGHGGACGSSVLGLKAMAEMSKPVC